MGLLLAEAICVSAFILEIDRALSGNTLSWAYVFEWPIFAFYAVYMWRRLLRDDEIIDSEKILPRASEIAALEAYNAYLKSLHGEHR